MKEKKIKKISIIDKLKIRKKIHQQIINNLPEINESKYMIKEEYILNPCIKITDFGFYCHDDEKFNESFGTRYYQSPENILRGKCNEKVDIWALGCMIYELVTGKILFDPYEDKYGTIDFYHLEMMINLCGEFTPNIINNTKVGHEYFNHKGKLKKITYNKDFNETSLLKIENKIKSNSNIHEPELYDLIVKMLHLDPDKRISIADILNHALLTT